MSTITWKITNLQCSPRIYAYNNVVIIANWMCSITDQQNNKPVTANVEGFCTIPFIMPEDEGSFTEFESLTEQQIIEWCWNSGINKDLVEEEASNKLNAIIAPQIITLDLPWNG